MQDIKNRENFRKMIEKIVFKRHNYIPYRPYIPLKGI